MSTPTADHISKFLTSLLGRNVGVQESDTPVQKSTMAWFSDDEGNKAACVCDMPLSIYLGASLSLIHPGYAKDCVKDKDLPDNILENLGEVYNIAAGLFEPHIPFHQMHVMPSSIPGEVDSFVQGGAEEQLNLLVKIEGYGSGYLSLYTTIEDE